MTRLLPVLALLALAGCSQGSPHGYAAVGAGSSTGINIGVSPSTGMPQINIGTQEGRFAIWPTLDGQGEAFDPAAIMACLGIEAGTGATVMSSIATAKAAEKGCPR